MVEGTLNGHTFQAPLEPENRASSLDFQVERPYSPLERPVQWQAANVSNCYTEHWT